MDSLQITVDGREYMLRPSWRASVDIADQVCDPMTIGAEMTKVETFAERGMNYRPDFQLGFVNSVQILGIAARANGHDLSDDQIGEEYSGGKMMDAVTHAATLIGLMLTPGPAKPSGKPKRQPKRRKAGAK